MNRIVKNPIQKLGYDFIPESFLPHGQDEYYIRDQQNGPKSYRHLTAREIEKLVINNNTSDDWNKLLVAEAFDADLVNGCHFYGLVRIGKLEPYYLEFHNLRLAVGIYNSTIASCDFGDNVVVHNVNYLSHYIVGNEVMLTNINEMATTHAAKFGNGILKEGEEEKARLWMEICNENAGRSILPFEGMLPGDAYLWTKYRSNTALMNAFRNLTDARFDARRGAYGTVGDRSVIKNCKIIKDTCIGSDAYIKGANKIKNVTVNSNAEAPTQIGEGCELVNGIIGLGCRVFYGVKAVRFFMASHSSLKYGARLINSYMGDNATVSCCEVLNSLIYPAHEQHHNNSFLCAALLMGQSNMAAGATIGSNHNSRGADGEIIAGRGFWPGLCVSLKHNSKFATFTLIAKGDYPAEINLPIPFSLLVHEVSLDMLRIMPGYWFLYNMYALARNSWKHQDRDKRTEKIQCLEYDYLAPDSVEEMFGSLELMERATGEAILKHKGYFDDSYSVAKTREVGKKYLLEHPDEVKSLEITVRGIENSQRKVELIKLDQAYPLFCRMIVYYGVQQLIHAMVKGTWSSFATLMPLCRLAKRESWTNVGGQLIRHSDLEQLIADVSAGTLNSWDAIHARYEALGADYSRQKTLHALASLLEIKHIKAEQLKPELLKGWIQEAVETQRYISAQIRKSREKDYINPFRKMTYDSQEEMDAVLGTLEGNSFIQMVQTETKHFEELAQMAMLKIKD